MARDGLFRDLDAALTWHPGDTNEVTVGSYAACIQVAYKFQGRAAHAAGNPWTGRSALDAAELMNIGVQFLREHMPPKACIHYSISDTGGLSPNVVQPTAGLIYMVRAANVRAAKALLERVNKIAQGAAMMTETSVSWHQIDGTSDTLSNTVLEELLYKNLQEVPLPAYTSEELSYAEALKATFPDSRLPGRLTEDNPKLKAFVLDKTQGGTAPINDFVMPYISACPYTPGSTDVGDVSWLTPTAQFTAATVPSGAPGHSWQIVSCGKTGIAHKGLLYAAKVLAASVGELMTDEALLAKARAEFNVTAAQGYDCPIPPDLIAAPQ